MVPTIVVVAMGEMGSGVGWRLKAIAGKKRVLLELGGNAAAIVHEDAPLPWALDRIVAGAFGYAGQTCIKVQRLYLHRAIDPSWLASLVDAANAAQPTSPLYPSALCGPMIDEANAQRVERWVGEIGRASCRERV